MKFQEYIAKQIVGEAFYNILERIAFALEVIAGIKTIEQQKQVTTPITMPEFSLEDVYNEEQQEKRKTISDKMQENVSKSQWAEDNLSADELDIL